MNDVHTCNLRELLLSKCIVRREFLEMAGGSFAAAGVAKERAEQYKGRVTAYVVIDIDVSLSLLILILENSLLIMLYSLLASILVIMLITCYF